MKLFINTNENTSNVPIFEYNLDIFLIYYVILVITVVIIHKFHLKNPDANSILFVKDEPMANKFIFAYGIATIPFIHLLVIAIVILIYILAFLAVFIVTFGDEFFIMDIPEFFTIFFPWYVEGYSIIEIIAFLVAGFHIGYYSEEIGWQIYINSALVFTVYSVMSNSMLFMFTQPDFNDFTMINLFIILLELLLIIIGTYFGNSKSKEDRSVERYDPEVGLPAMKEYMRYIYLYSILILLVVLAVVLVNYDSLLYSILLIIPTFSIYIIAMNNLYQGDVSPDNDKEKIIFIDPDTGEVDVPEPLPVVSKLIFTITAICGIISLIIFLINIIRV